MVISTINTSVKSTVQISRMTVIFAVYTHYGLTKVARMILPCIGTHLLGHPDRSNEEVIRHITSWVQTAALPECTMFSQVRFIYIRLHKIQVQELVWIVVLQQAMVIIAKS